MKFVNKSIKFLLTFFFASILFISSVQTLRKTDSVMDFLNDLFQGKNNEEKDLGNLEQTDVSYSFLEAKNSTSSNNTNQTNVMLIEGFLKIKSDEFKNKNKFPNLNVNGKKLKIRTDELDFRINEGYDEKKKDADSPKTETDFYFRLVKNLIYYSLNKKDVNIIGSIEVIGVKEISFFLPGAKNDDLCFSVTDTQFMQWDLCTESSELMKKWMCKTNIGLGKFKNENECNEQANKKASSENKSVNATLNLINNDVVYQPIIVIPLPSKDCNSGWDYASKGNNWECGCSEGSEQSPIDIPDKSGVIDSPISPLFTFEAVPAKSPITTIDGELKSQEYIKIKYFKNALRILHSNLGKVVTLDGSIYIGEEIVFHTPSEHKINGKAFDMEMQVIFYGRTKGDIAKQVVLSFLFQKKAGVYNKFLDDIDFFSLPNSANPGRDIVHDLYIPKVFQRSNDDNDIILKPFSFYTYQGSLTMPPCSEGTIHYVVADPIPLASVPIQLFQEAIRANNSEGSEGNENNRETQPHNGRSVFFFDREKYGFEDIQQESKKTKKSENGHYEVVKRRVDDFVYVNGKDPSGLPGALVVPSDK